MAFVAVAACAPRRAPVDSIAYERLGCAGLCAVDRLTIDRRGRVQYDGYRNVPRLGHYLGRIDVATAAAAFAAFDREGAETQAPRDTVPDAQRIALSVARGDGSGSREFAHVASASVGALRVLDGVRDGARLVVASWEDPYLGYYARENGPDTLDVLTIEDASPGDPIAYARTTRVESCVPRGLSDRAVSRGRLVRDGARVRYEPERSEFDPAARRVGLRIVRGGLALHGETRERIFIRLSQTAYLARLDRFQANVDARHDAPCTR